MFISPPNITISPLLLRKLRRNTFEIILCISFSVLCFTFLITASKSHVRLQPGSDGESEFMDFENSQEQNFYEVDGGTGKRSKKGTILKNEKFVKKRFENRRLFLKEACRKYRDEDAMHLNKTVIRLCHSRKYNLVGCIVPKNGGSTWRKHFLRMNGANDDTIDVWGKDAGIKVLGAGNFNSLNTFLTYTKLKTTTNILNVRNPLDRLVSAYRDKFNNGKYKGSQYKEWFQMAEKFLQKSLKISDKDYEISFSEFVDFVLSTEYTRENMHFKPVSQRCSPCDIRYDYIIHQETFDEDSKFILNGLDVTETDSGLRSNPTSKNTQTSYMHYYEDLNLALREKVITFLKDDFLLFGYEIPIFMQLASNRPNATIIPALIKGVDDGEIGKIKKEWKRILMKEKHDLYSKMKEQRRKKRFLNAA